MGLRIDYLKDLLKSYEDKFNVKAYLVDEAGDIEISTAHTGYNKINWFEHLGTENIQKEVLDWKEDQSSKEIWTQSTGSNSEEKYVVTRYLPELSWHLIVEQNTGRIISEMHQRILQTCLMILVVIVTILFVITTVIRNFNKQITHLMEEKQKIFQKATEQLYDNIYELNITQNCAAGKRTQEYFADLGAADLPYDQALSVIANKTIKEEFREGYVNLFSPKNVLREYDAGNDHLRYDFMITQGGSHYFWMRIDAHIFYMPEDHSIHMFTYRKNIDEEKRRELQIEKKAQVDEMTGFLSKKTTERLIDEQLLETPDKQFGFFIFDIDNFKQANDQFGHAFGDACIKEFTRIIKTSFRETDLLGRLGGDEFAAFIPVSSEDWVEEKATELSQSLHTVYSDGANSWEMSASIGIALTSTSIHSFDTLYKSADSALYEAKKRGKNSYTIYKA